MKPQNFTIYCAEDDEDDRYLLTKAFTKPNGKLWFFNDGQQLIDYLLHQESKSLPTLILLDLNMPILDGFSTLKLIKNDDRLRAIPVLILTTSDAEQDIKRCYEVGANAYICKPNTYGEWEEMANYTLAYWLNKVRLPTHLKTDL